MKKKIEKLLESKSGLLRINRYIVLHRWQIGAFGDTVDILQVESSIRSACDGTRIIESRDFLGIVEEVNDFQRDMFSLASEEYIKQFKNGNILGNGVIE